MKNAVIVIALTGLVTTPSAFAGSSFPMDFRYDRQDLNSEEGANAVYSRLRGQIAEACEFTNGRRGLAAARIERDCVEDTLASAIKSINSKSLKAVHDQQVTSQIG